VPDESLEFHAGRNDLSHWFRARGELTLAAVLRPITIADFPTVAALKEYLINAISIARREKYRGTIADFRPPEFDPTTRSVSRGCWREGPRPGIRFPATQPVVEDDRIQESRRAPARRYRRG
jgi:hypothetical protein